MTKLSADEIRAFVDLLRGDQPTRRVSALKALRLAPTLEPAVVEAIEALLSDRQVAILSLPILYGELRYLAAETLAATRAVAGRMDDIVVLDPGYGTLKPAALGQATRDAEAAGHRVPALDPLERYAWLRDHGLLPGKRLEFHPRMYDPGVA
jgi:hypothetical protein